MAHLSPIKGGFPNKDQHDRTCPVKAGQSPEIERGTVLTVEDGEFRIAIDTDVGAAPLYLALQPQDNLQARMAGFFSLGTGKYTPDADGVGGKSSAKPKGNVGGSMQAAISGIRLDGGDVWETDMFNEDNPLASGDKVTVDAGKFVKAADDATTFVGWVREAPYDRWINDKKVAPGFLTGGTGRVIQIEVA